MARPCPAPSAVGGTPWHLGVLARQPFGETRALLIRSSAGTFQLSCVADAIASVTHTRKVWQVSDAHSCALLSLGAVARAAGASGCAPPQPIDVPLCCRCVTLLLPDFGCSLQPGLPSYSTSLACCSPKRQPWMMCRCRSCCAAPLASL
jgi:hypothetical protein